jgi:broad specificity phosphatase PhoE
MTMIYLVRHGQPETGWNAHQDPGLSDLGRSQAHTVARGLFERGPLPILVSPLRRTRETAYEFEMLWRRPATVEERVVEIPSPGLTGVERSAWLKTLGRKRWTDLDEAVQSWRKQAIDCLLALSEDTVVVSHFMIINAVVGWAHGEESIVVCQPLPGSLTTLERVGDSFRVKGGAVGASTVL